MSTSHPVVVYKHKRLMQYMIDYKLTLHPTSVFDSCNDIPAPIARFCDMLNLERAEHATAQKQGV